LAFGLNRQREALKPNLAPVPSAGAFHGPETAQIYANVLATFTNFPLIQASFFNDLAGVILVRDEGVAGSNPATPTSFLIV
jgi:hypothetical protein